MYVLSLASILFYTYWSPVYLLLILAEVSFSFLIGRMLTQASLSAKARRATIVGSITLLLVTLGYFKYTNMILSGIGFALNKDFPVLAIVLPLGISFHTFQQIAYLVDAYKGRAPRYSFGAFSLFVVFFPQLIAGPIVHHYELIPQFARKHWTRPIPRNLVIGFAYFSLGLFKKTMIADCLAQIANPVFDTAASGLPISSVEAWLGTLAYTLQIYFDFSAYSDMAVGLARMFNLRLPVNFFSPYKAGNISQFWRRWHISLSRFLRDYLYIPLGGSRHGSARASCNLLLTMLIGGLWHGAGLQFVVWGGLHGLYLVIHRAFSRAVPDRLRTLLVYRAIAATITFFSVMLAWVFFRAADLPTALHILSSMLPLSDETQALKFKFITRAPFDGWPVLLLALGLAFLAPNLLQIFRRYSPALTLGVLDPGTRACLSDDKASFISWRPGIRAGIVVGLCFAAGFLAMFAWQSEFLYFQF